MNVKTSLKFAGAVAIMALAAACSSTKATGPDVAAGRADKPVVVGAVAPATLRLGGLNGAESDE